MIDSKVLSLLLELLHFQGIHRRFIDTVDDAIFRQDNDMVSQSLNKLMVVTGKDDRFFEVF